MTWQIHNPGHRIFHHFHQFCGNLHPNWVTMAIKALGLKMATNMKTYTHGDWCLCWPCKNWGQSDDNCGHSVQKCIFHGHEDWLSCQPLLLKFGGGEFFGEKNVCCAHICPYYFIKISLWNEPYGIFNLHTTYMEVLPITQPKIVNVSLFDLNVLVYSSITTL